MPGALRVLYVDDEPQLLEIGRLFIEQSGDISVKTIDSAAKAFDIIKKETFDAIISDYQMPDIDGIQFLRQLKASGNTIPFIIFTGRGREEVVIQALNEGADFYIQKGGDPGAQFAELINKVRYAVQKRKAERGVSEAGERYKAFILVSNTGAWEYHDDTGFLWCSPEYLSMLGRDASQLDFSGKANLKETWIDLLHPEDREQADRHFKDYLANGSVGMYEGHFRMLHSDGHWVWIWSRGSTLRDRDGNLTSKTVGTHIDVTESKLAEEAIINNNERLRMAQEIGKTGSWELDLATGTIWSSEEAFRIFAIPQPADQIISIEDVEARIPERDRVHRALMDLIENGADYNIEYVIEPADKSIHRIVHSVARVLFNDEKKPVRVVGVIHDITDLKRAEEQALLAGKEWERTFNAVPDLISLLDTTHTIRRVNQAMATKLGITPDEAVGLTCYQCVHNTQSPPDFCPHVMLLKDQKEHIMEVYEERLGGRFLVTCTPLWDNDGKLLGSVHVAHDITERKRAEEALKKSRVQLAGAMDLAHMANWEFDVDTGIFTFDDRFYALYGTTAELEGGNQMPAEVYAREFVHPDDQYLVAEEIKKAILATDPDYLSQVEHRIIRRDGEVRYIVVRFGITKDAAGRMVKTHGANQDITDRNMAEKALAESESRLNSIIRVAPVGIGVSVSRIIQAVNDQFCQLTGYAAEELIGKSARFLYPSEEDYDYVGKEKYGQIASKGHGSVETRFQKKDGTIIDVLLSSTPIDPSDLSMGVTFTALDITERKRAENELRFSERKFAAAFEASPDPIAITDVQTGIILDINHAFEEWSGYEQAEISGKTTRDLNFWVYPEERDAVVKQVSTGGIILKKEVTFRTKKGDIRDILFSAKIFGVGNTSYMLSLAEDITGQKTAEVELRKSEEKYRLLIDQTDEGVWVIDQDYRTTFVNNRLASMFGYSPREMLGKAVREFLPVEDMPVHNQRMKERLEGKRDRFEQRFIRKDGSVFWGIAAVTPFVSENNVSGAFAMLSDITDRKRAEEELRHLTQFQDGVITNARVWLSVLDLKGRILLWNTGAEELSGYTSDEVVGQKEIWKKIYPDPDYRKQVTNTITRIIRDNNYLENFETTIISKQGIKKVISWNTRGIPDATGNVSDYIAIGVDVTARKRADEALHQANRKLNLLSGITRHDINNQLLVLNGFLTLLRKKAPDPELADYFTRITKASSRISTMIQFTKEYEEIGVNAPVWQDTRALIDIAAKQAPLGKVLVKNELPAGTEVFADPLVVRVFYNLMDNAARYGGKITTIRFSALESGDGTIIVCEDDGEGIPVEEKEKIFERGFGKNTGLGLFLSREILDITGITIKETGEPGKGARFEMTVPKGAWRGMEKE